MPDSVRLDEAGWAGVLDVIDRALADRPPAVRRQVALFLRVLDVLPVVRYGRRFRFLEAERRHRTLAALQDAPLLLLRRGVWGVRTLVFMGFYARDSAAREIGYRADPRGWSAPHRQSS